MKAVLSNRIYMSVTPELQESINKELTYSIPNYIPTDPPLIINNWALVRKALISIPTGRTDLIPDDYEIVDKRMCVPVDFPDFKLKLRESQQKVYDELEASCMINARLGWGNTFTIFALAAKLKQKILIITHTVPL